jgi:branched-chain amino acid transport system ATP-binding protein
MRTNEASGEPSIGLQVRQVSIAFAGVQALQDVSFDVPSGVVTALIGPNGAGKTTMLNAISGIYASSGVVSLDGVPQNRSQPDERCRRGIARTFQTPSLLEDHSVLDNVMLGGHSATGGRVLGRPSRSAHRELRERSLDLLERFGIADRASDRVADLAHADRRRVETARALVTSPRVVLLDEPAAGLDDDEAQHLLGLAAELADTCVLVEHNMSLVMSVARYVVVLAAGQVLATGTPDEVRTNPSVIEAYLGDGVV